MSPVAWSRPDILRALSLQDRLSADFIWRVNPAQTDVQVYVNCSDVFWWACSDAELFKPGDIRAMERAAHDLGEDNDHLADILWVCRKRKMRPQGPWYGYYVWDAARNEYTAKIRRRFVPLHVEALFDAAGPEREDSPKSPRPADGRRWDYGGEVEPPDFVDHFKPGGKFGP